MSKLGTEICASCWRSSRFAPRRTQPRVKFGSSWSWLPDFTPGYTLSFHSLHDISYERLVLAVLRPPFDLARDSPEEKAQFSRNIFVSERLAVCETAKGRKFWKRKKIHETKKKRGERKWRNIWWKRSVESVDHWLISLFFFVSPLDAGKDLKRQRASHVGFPSIGFDSFRAGFLLSPGFHPQIARITRFCLSGTSFSGQRERAPFDTLRTFLSHPWLSRRSRILTNLPGSRTVKRFPTK